MDRSKLEYFSQLNGAFSTQFGVYVKHCKLIMYCIMIEPFFKLLRYMDIPIWGGM